MICINHIISLNSQKLYVISSGNLTFIHKNNSFYIYNDISFSSLGFGSIIRFLSSADGVPLLWNDCAKNCEQ